MRTGTWWIITAIFEMWCFFQTTNLLAQCIIGFLIIYAIVGAIVMYKVGD